MSDPPPVEPTPKKEGMETSVARFLEAVGKKTESPLHRRLLAACLEPDPARSLDATLQAAIDEILHEA